MGERRAAHRVAKTQATFDTIRTAARIRSLSEKERRILGYLDQQLCQSTIAKRLNVSSPCINKYVRQFESEGLIQRIQPKPRTDGKREYSHFYTVSTEARAQLTGDNALPITSFHVHHIGIKYKVLKQTRPLSKDRRVTGYEPKVWYPRPRNEKIVYWFPGREGLPRVTIAVHGKTWITWVEKGQLIAAASIEDAERLGDQAIAEAVRQFIDKQRSFGVYIQTDNGTIIGERHYGLLAPEKNAEFQRTLKEGTGVKDWRADKSPDDQLPGTGEWETNFAEHARPVEVLLGMAPQLVKLAEMPTQVSQLTAMVQGGITVQQQYQQMINFMTKALTEMTEMRKELVELRKKVGD